MASNAFYPEAPTQVFPTEQFQTGPAPSGQYFNNGLPNQASFAEDWMLQGVPSPATPVKTQVRVGLLVWAAILGIIGLMMIIVPLAGSNSLRGILVVLFLATGGSLIALAVWLARHPGSTMSDAGRAIFEKTRSKEAKSQPNEQQTNLQQPVAQQPAWSFEEVTEVTLPNTSDPGRPDA